MEEKKRNGLSEGAEMIGQLTELCFLEYDVLNRGRWSDWTERYEVLTKYDLDEYKLSGPAWKRLFRLANLLDSYLPNILV